METIIENAFIEILSGIAQYHKDGGVISEDKYNGLMTISFPTQNPKKAVIRRYWANGQLKWKDECRQGKLHGKSIGWYEDGTKRWKHKYQNGQIHGKCINWYENGIKSWEVEYQNGKLIK